MTNDMKIRGLRTKKALSDSMLELLRKRDFSKITVNDICLGASVSRATFYVHFEDKYALARFCLTVIADQMTKALDGKGHREVIEGILDTLHSYKKELLNLFTGGGDREIELVLYQSLARDYQVVLESREEPPHVDVPIPMIAGFIGAGSTYLVLSWLQDGFPYTREEMVHYLMELTRPN